MEGEHAIIRIRLYQSFMMSIQSKWRHSLSLPEGAKSIWKKTSLMMTLATSPNTPDLRKRKVNVRFSRARSIALLYYSSSQRNPEDGERTGKKKFVSLSHVSQDGPEPKRRWTPINVDVWSSFRPFVPLQDSAHHQDRHSGLRRVSRVVVTSLQLTLNEESG